MRAIRARYNPYLQAKHRLEQVSMLHDYTMYMLHTCFMLADILARGG